MSSNFINLPNKYKTVNKWLQGDYSPAALAPDPKRLNVRFQYKADIHKFYGGLVGELITNNDSIYAKTVYGSVYRNNIKTYISYIIQYVRCLIWRWLQSAAS